MHFVFYSINLSPHQLPLAKAVAKIVGRENFLYVAEVGNWRGRNVDSEGLCVKSAKDAVEDLENCDVLCVGGLRPIGLIERRAARGLKTLYISERWFKPVLGLSGRVRLLFPRYRKMLKRFVNVVNENACVKFLAIGPHSKNDFLRMGVPPGKIIPWGYFVAPSSSHSPAPPLPHSPTSSPLALLWLGRMLWCKRVDTIIRAVRICRKRGVDISLDIYGSGWLKPFLKILAVGQRDAIRFHPFVSFEKARELMRAHSVYVFSSNGYDGWGVVVNEALLEGMHVVGTFEAGASAAMLPMERLYHCGDVEALADLIVKECAGKLPPCTIADWTVEEAAKKLVEM